MASSTASTSQDKDKSVIADTVAQASKKVDDVTSSAKQTVQQAYESVESVGSEFDRAIRKSIREQPMMTLALAAAFGFAIGAIWKD